MKSTGERLFETYWRALDGQALESEYRWHPQRRWRFDFADPASKTAIEIDGGAWSGGRHTRGDGFERDCEKINAATMMGWAVIRLTPQMIERDPESELVPIMTLIEERRERAA